MNKEIHIIGGGTISHVRGHLALCAPAYGTTARKLEDICYNKATDRSGPSPTFTQAFSVPEASKSKGYTIRLHLTRMAGGTNLETNEDISNLIDKLIEDPNTKIIFMSAAMCDFEGNIEGIESGKYADRLSTHILTDDANYECWLSPAPKIITKIRKKRKDIFLVGFKTTLGATEQEQYLKGLKLCKEASCNLVLANDTKTRVNMIITPEEAAYDITTDRDKVLNSLVEIALGRSELNFTRSTVVEGEQVAWQDERVPQSLRTVVDHCIENGAYKTFKGSTVGHFAAKIGENKFLTSRRKTNFNYLNSGPSLSPGLVLVESSGKDSVTAHGYKPSVGGQSQRIIFKDHPEYDCIVHFHCPLRNIEFGHDDIPIKSQRLIECGSHECGQNTSNGIKKFGNLSAVMLDQHGPNIVFNRNIDPKEVISFIEANFHLSRKTGGFDL